LQPAGNIPVSQNRLDFTPSPEEIAEVALAHIAGVKQAVVSFGQGCEGDPLLAAEVIEPAIRKIRAATSAGTINLNTNASRPRVLARLLDAGLDSVRISINSIRPACYVAYFRPRDYGFGDVLESLKRTLAMGKHTALNYLNMPGFTDSPQEVSALQALLEAHALHLIQWRNLNFDPLRYHQAMAAAEPSGAPRGMAGLVNGLRRKFPGLRHGYFNPPKEKFGPGAHSPKQRGKRP
jgi:pyruvate-formate lyase-activating enzyme